MTGKQISPHVDITGLFGNHTFRDLYIGCRAGTSVSHVCSHESNEVSNCFHVNFISLPLGYRIVPGEVFLLLSRLNDDWGWGRSQRTGESGLIPIVIMEDMVCLSVCPTRVQTVPIY